MCVLIHEYAGDVRSVRSTTCFFLSGTSMYSGGSLEIFSLEEIEEWTETTINTVVTSILATSTTIIAIFSLFFSSTLPKRYFTMGDHVFEKIPLEPEDDVDEDDLAKGTTSVLFSGAVTFPKIDGFCTTDIRCKNN